MRRLPENSVILFGGAADAEEDNIRELLNMHLPRDLGAGIQAEIPSRGYRGLKKVRTWLDEELKDDIELIDDMTGYVSSLEDVSDTYLVVLYGDGNNRETEELVSAARDKGITVLDLTAGMDELQFTSEPAGKSEQQEAGQARTGRRSRRAAARAAEPAAESSDREAAAATVTPISSEPAPWEPDTSSDDIQVAARALGQAVEGVAAEFLRKTGASAGGQAGAAVPDPAGAKPAGTRTWLQNPENPDELIARGRGRQRPATAGWYPVHLTPAQEKALGLSAG